MIKKEINRGYYRYVLEYDDTKYDIKYCKFSYSFILLNKEGIALCTFPRSIGFIKQVNVGDKTYFMVSNHSNTKGNNIKKIDSLEQLQIIDKGTPTVEVCECSNIDSVIYEEVVLGDSSFLISCDGGSAIYSLSKDLISRTFQKVYKNDNYKDVIGTNIVVEEMIVASKYNDVPDIYDVITYGIDPVSLEIKSRIFSKNQNRFIDLYSEDKVKEVVSSVDYLVSKKIKGDTYDQAGTTTIVNEVLIPLEKQAKYKSFILSDVSKEEQSEFIKKLGTYPEES